jgi:hypothetical protein
VQAKRHPTRRWPRRLIAAIASCLVGAIIAAGQIPAVRETIGIAKTVYCFIDATVPSLGVAALWLSFLLLVGGVLAGRWFRRSIKEEATRRTAVGSAVIAVALGGVLAVVATVNQPVLSPERTPPPYEAKVGKHHWSHGRHHHRDTAARSGGSKTTSTPLPAPRTDSAPALAPSSAPSASSSSSGGSGGNGNTITLNKNNHQKATSGSAEGSGATSGPATNNNNEGPVNIAIG